MGRSLLREPGMPALAGHHFGAQCEGTGAPWPPMEGLCSPVDGGQGNKVWLQDLEEQGSRTGWTLVSHRPAGQDQALSSLGRDGT